MSELRVEKSVKIKASPEKVYAVIRDFRQSPAWSPWLIAEPECLVKYSDDGKSHSCEGKILGSSEIKIVNEEPFRSIDCRLTFFKPWKSVAAVQFTFEELDGGTEVTWSMKGSLPFFLFWMKPMMTTLIGMDYQRGLTMLKDFIELGSVPSKLDFIGQTSQTGFSYVGVKTSCAIADIGDRMKADFQKLQDWIDKEGPKPSGNPFANYYQWNFAKGIVGYTTGFPVVGVPGNLPDGFVSGDLPGCHVFSIKHTGPYRHLGNAWSAGMLRARAKIFAQDKKIPPFEIYENDPCKTPENDLITTVCFPIK